MIIHNFQSNFDIEKSEPIIAQTKNNKNEAKGFVKNLNDEESFILIKKDVDLIKVLLHQCYDDNYSELYSLGEALASLNIRTMTASPSEFTDNTISPLDIGGVRELNNFISGILSGFVKLKYEHVITELIEALKKRIR